MLVTARDGQRRCFAVALATFPVILVLGGAGNGYPLIGLAGQIAALILIGAVLAEGGEHRGTGVRCGYAVAAAAIALPVLQLLPVPHAAWLETSGQRLRDAVAATLGARPSTQPLTLDTDATLGAGLALLPALALFAAAVRLSPRRQRVLLALVVIVAAGSAALGAFQLSAAALPLFADAHARNAPGLFVNRNHQAAFLAVALVLTPVVLPATLPGRGETSRLGIAAVMALFAGGVVATTSRAGLVLLLPALAAGSALALRPRPRAAFGPGAMLAAAAAAGLAAWGALRLDAVRRVAARFADTDDRSLFWHETWPAIRDFWPTGSGLGTFTRILPRYEEDAAIGPYMVNAAHDDYLQLLLEGGLPALALMVAGLALLGWATIRLVRSHPGLGPYRIGRRGDPAALDRRTGLVAAAALLLILLHSLVDYPLRMPALMAVFGLLAGVVLSAADRTLAARGGH